MGYTNQALSAVYLMQNRGRLSYNVHSVPLGLDQKIARIKLTAMDIAIDSLTPVQKHYLNSWRQGT